MKLWMLLPAQQLIFAKLVIFFALHSHLIEASHKRSFFFFFI